MASFLALGEAIILPLLPLLLTGVAGVAAATDVASNPEDEDLQTTLRVQLKKILDKDTALASEIAQILQEESTTAAGGDKIQLDVSGNSKQVIGKMGGNAKAVGEVHGDVSM